MEILKPRRYLAVASEGEAPVLQLVGRKVWQDTGNISGSIWSAAKRNLGVAVATNRHIPARDIGVDEPLTQLLAGWNSRRRAISKKRTGSKPYPRTCQYRTPRMAYPKLSTGFL